MSDSKQKHVTAGQGDEAGKKEAEQGIRTTVSREGSCTCTIRVEVDADCLKKRYEERLATLRKEAQLPGFRTGKAPLELVLRRFGDKIKQEVLGSAALEGYDQAVEKNNLSVVEELESPKPEQMQWQVGESAEFEFKCEVLPVTEFHERDYKGLAVKVPRFEMTEELLRQELNRFARQLASWEKVEAAGIDREDYVEAEVSLASQADEAGRWRQTLGFYPRDKRIGPFSAEGIQGALLDARAGQTVQVDAELPEGADVKESALAELAGEPVKLNVAIKAVYREKVPEIDDQLASRLNLKGVEEIHALVRQRLKERLEAEKKEATRYALMEGVLANIPVDMPESLIKRATADEQKKLIVRALRAGMPRDEVEKLTRETAERAREVAVRNLKAAFLLRQIADRERIYVLDPEVQEQVRAFAARQGWTESRAQRYFEENDLMQPLRWDMREEKTLQFLVENAKLEEVDPAEFARLLRESRQHAQATPGQQ